MQPTPVRAAVNLARLHRDQDRRAETSATVGLFRIEIMRWHPEHRPREGDWRAGHGREFLRMIDRLPPATC